MNPNSHPSLEDYLATDDYIDQPISKNKTRLIVGAVALTGSALLKLSGNERSSKLLAAYGAAKFATVLVDGVGSMLTNPGLPDEVPIRNIRYRNPA